MSIPAPLLAHYQTRATTVADALLIVRADGQRYAFTTHDLSIDIDVSALLETAAPDVMTFDAGLGLDATAIVTSVGSAVDNLEVSSLDDGSLFTPDDVAQGRWRNAPFWIFRYNYNATTEAEQVDVRMRGTCGEVRPSRNMVVLELRGSKQRMRQAVGSALSITCRARLGDDACGVDLAPYTFTTTVTSVASKSVFTCAGLAQAADYFSEGMATFTLGGNAALPAKVRQHEAGGVIHLSWPMWKEIQVGDTLTIVAGCNKTRDMCRDKFDNVRRMQAEPDSPGIDRLTTQPVPPA